MRHCSTPTDPAAFNLLLVEDDPLVRLTIAMMLEEHGFAVAEAGSGEQAVSMMEQGLQAPVLITDVDLGPGCSGLELADRLHKAWPDLGVVFITGRLTSMQGRVMGPHEAVLPKPFGVGALARLVARVAPV